MLSKRIEGELRHKELSLQRQKLRINIYMNGRKIYKGNYIELHI